jgi:hypothetical protein
MRAEYIWLSYPIPVAISFSFISPKASCRGMEHGPDSVAGMSGLIAWVDLAWVDLVD